MQKRTMLAWFEHLDTPGREYSETEFMMLMLFHLRQNAGQANARMLAAMQATEHVEGMLGAIDQFASDLAARSGIPYARSDTVRAALDAKRDTDRALADEQRRTAITSQEDAA